MVQSSAASFSPSIALAVAVAILAGGCANQVVLFPPARYAPDAADARFPRLKPYERHFVATNTGRIETWYWDLRDRQVSLWPPADDATPAGKSNGLHDTDDNVDRGLASSRPSGDLPDTIILMSCGNAMLAHTAQLWVEQLYAGRSIGVLAWNYPGYGASDGKQDLAAMMSASEQVFDRLHAAVGDRPIILHGLSIGSCISAHLAARRPVAGVIVDGPPRIPQIVLSPRWSWWNLYLASSVVALQVPSDYDPIDNARRVRADCPLLVIHGDEDVIAPLADGRALLDAWAGGPKSLVVIQGVGHAPGPIIRAPREYRRGVDAFLHQIGRSPRNVDSTHK